MCGRVCEAPWLVPWMQLAARAGSGRVRGGDKVECRKRRSWGRSGVAYKPETGTTMDISRENENRHYDTGGEKGETLFETLGEATLSPGSVHVVSTISVRQVWQFGVLGP